MRLHSEAFEDMMAEQFNEMITLLRDIARGPSLEAPRVAALLEAHDAARSAQLDVDNAQNAARLAQRKPLN